MTAIVVASIFVVGLLVGGGLFLTSRGDDGKDDGITAQPSDTPSATAESEQPSHSPEESDEPTAPPSFDFPSPSASPRPSNLIPFVVLEPGTCFDHPSLSSAVTEVEKRSCNEPHNAEVIANRKLTGDVDTQSELQEKVRSLCQTETEKRMKRIPADGRTYYSYSLYPTLWTYKYGDEDQVTCAMTISKERDGTKLTAPLPG